MGQDLRFFSSSWKCQPASAQLSLQQNAIQWCCLMCSRKDAGVAVRRFPGPKCKSLASLKTPVWDFINLFAVALMVIDSLCITLL